MTAMVFSPFPSLTYFYKWVSGASVFGPRGKEFGFDDRDVKALRRRVVDRSEPRIGEEKKAMMTVFKKRKAMMTVLPRRRSQ